MDTSQAISRPHSISREHHKWRLLSHASSVRLELTNSDTELLDYAQELLAELKINSRAGQYKGASPVISSIRGKPVFLSSPTFWLQITQQLSLHRFAENVGFTIERKQRKLAVALSLIRSVGTQEAATEWLRIYTKKGSRWVKRDRAPELDEASLSRDSVSENGPVVQPVKTPPSQRKLMRTAEIPGSNPGGPTTETWCCSETEG